MYKLRKLKYSLIILLTFAVLATSTGFSMWFFPVSNTSKDNVDITTKAEVNKIYENYTFEGDEDETYVLYFFPSMAYIDIYSDYLSDPNNSPKPEEAFGYFEIEEDDLLGEPLKDPNNPSYPLVKNGGVAKGYNGCSTYASFISNITDYPNENRTRAAQTAYSQYVSGNDNGAANYRTSSIQHYCNDRYGGWAEYDTFVQVDSSGYTVYGSDNTPSFSLTPQTGYKERRYLPLRIEVKYSLSTNKFYSMIDYPIAAIYEDSGYFEDNKNYEWYVANSVSDGSGGYKISCSYTTRQEGSNPKDMGPCFEFSSDLSKYLNKIKPENDDSNVIRIFPRFFISEDAVIDPISNGGYSQTLAEIKGRDGVFFLGWKGSNIIRDASRVFTYSNEHYTKEGDIDLYNGNSYLHYAVGRQLCLETDFDYLDVRLDPLQLDSSLAYTYTFNRKAFEIKKKEDYDYSNKYINIYMFVANSSMSIDANSIVDSSISVDTDQSARIKDFIKRITNDKENFPSLYKKDLQYDFSKVGLELYKGNQTDAHYTGANTNGVNLGSSTDESHNNQVYVTKSYNSTSDPKYKKYMVILYEIDSDNHLYSDNYDDSYFTGEDYSSYYNSYYEDNYTTTRTFQKIENAYSISESNIGGVEGGDTSLLGDVITNNTYIYRNANFSNTRSLNFQIASHHTENSSAWYNTSPTGGVYVPSAFSSGGKVFKKLDGLTYSLKNGVLTFSFDQIRGKGLYDLLIVRRMNGNSFESYNTYTEYYDIYAYRYTNKFIKIIDEYMDLGTVVKDYDGDNGYFIDHYNLGEHLLWANKYGIGDYLCGGDICTSDSSILSGSPCSSLSMYEALKAKYGNATIYLCDYVLKKPVIRVDLSKSSNEAFVALGDENLIYGDISYFYKITSSAILYVQS
ncbi:MAG: hypothetical protein ACI4U5_03775 [Bacilli bacterium]